MSGYVDTSFVIGVAFKTMSNSPVCDKVILLVGLEFSRNPFAFILEFLGAARIASNNSRQLHSLRSADWSCRLELEWCERKTLLPGLWLEAGVGAM